WQTPFDPERTASAPFIRPDGSAIDVPTMHDDGSFDYYEDDGLQAVRLPYGNAGELCFTAVVAREGLAPPSISDWDVLDTQPRTGSIALPRFSAEASLELDDA